MATPSLTGLPLELLVHLIATYLPTNDLGALRLTSKYLERSLFDTFAKEFFTKRQFMLSTFSLQTLVNISKHGALRHTLKHVIIGTESFEDSTGRLGSRGPDAANAFVVGSADQAALLSSGYGRDLLSEAFQNLPNLHTVGVRDYAASGRARDCSRWSSYGAPSISHQIGFRLVTGRNDFASRAFTLIVHALAEAARPIPAIEVIMRRNTQAGLLDSAFVLMPLGSRMDAVLHGLRQLLLTLNPDRGILYNTNPTHSHLTDFLLRTPGLDHLRMNVAFGMPAQLRTILQKLISTPDILPCIRRLDLGMASIEPDLLVEFISRFSATVDYVSLWKVSLTWAAHVRWTDAEDRFNPWPRVLRDLSSSTSLTGISLGCLSQQESGAFAPHILPVNFSAAQISREFLGDIKTWVHQAIDELVVQFPPPAPPVDESSSEEEHGSDEIYGSEEDEDEDSEEEA